MQSKARKYKLNKEFHTNNFGRFTAALSSQKTAIFSLFTACLSISIVLGKLHPPYEFESPRVGAFEFIGVSSTINCFFPATAGVFNFIIIILL